MHQSATFRDYSLDIPHLNIDHGEVAMPSIEVGKSPTVTEQDDPFVNRSLRQRGRSYSPPLKKAWLYDSENKSLTVHRREELEKTLQSIDLTKSHCTFLTSGHTGSTTYDTIMLGPRQKNVVLFLDTGSESISADRRNKEGHYNEPLAILSLNRSGFWNDILRLFGCIPILYVSKSSS